jgi:hypothetical protein
MTNDPGLEAFRRYAGSLQQELGGLFTAETVRGWAVGNPDRENFLANTILGTIRWSKSVGKPVTPALADGFIVTHVGTRLEVDQGPDGQPINLSHPVTLDPPILLDGNEDDDHYLVGFTDKVLGYLDENIKVALAPGQWQGGEPFAGTRQVQPLQAPTGPKEGRPVFLVFDVVIVPHFGT